MAKTAFIRAPSRSNERRQAYFLIVVGLLFLLAAWQLKPFPYPAGVFLFGLGMLLASIINPYRLTIAGLLMTLVGAAVYFAFKPVPFLPDAGALLIPAIAIALFGIALASRLRYVGRGAFSPAIIVLLIGLVEYPPFARLLPQGYVSFLLSLWFPGLALLALGIVYALVHVMKSAAAL